MHTSIVVIGSSNMDMIARVKQLPKPGETVGNARFSQAFGGKGANQAVAARRAGAQVIFITSLGDDMFGHRMQQAFTDEGINTDYMIIDPQNPTGTALIFVDEGGENCIAVAPGANHTLSPAHIDEAHMAISGAELILLQMEIPVETVTYILELAGSLGKKVLFNPAPAQTLDDKWLRHLHILVLNETEAEIMTGMKVETMEEVAAAAEAFLKKGIEMAIITLGERGAYYATRRERKLIAAYRVTPVDTTGAGDVFCGALAAALYKDQKPGEALRYASAAAAIATTHIGAQPSAPTEREIKAFLEEREF